MSKPMRDHDAGDEGCISEAAPLQGTTGRSLREILAPVHAALPPQETEEETEQLVEELISKVRSERRGQPRQTNESTIQ